MILLRNGHCSQPGTAIILVFSEYDQYILSTFKILLAETSPWKVYDWIIGLEERGLVRLVVTVLTEESKNNYSPYAADGTCSDYSGALPCFLRLPHQSIWPRQYDCIVALSIIYVVGGSFIATV
jgi:hypothetical protein